MQKLPVRYFDQNATGDIMSLYTNDTDTLRQMMAQSLPQFISSTITIVAVFVAMLVTSVWLTLFVIAFLIFMMVIVKHVGGKSGKYFVAQQASLGDVNGYVEEMIHGQKVVKVFCHEPQAAAVFDEKNEGLFENATKANSFANILMPITNNLGNLQYVCIAILGGVLALHGVGGLTLGAIAAFLQLSKSFTQPIGQISQQASAIVMALAGAGRIFHMLDEQPEQDEGYVHLVNAERDADGNLRKADHRTHLWAWEHPHQDGTVTYTQLQGDVQMEHVDFGYVPEKIVLHDVSLYAKPGQKIAFVGATGAGKTTIQNELVKRGYKRGILHTTRSKRASEINGRDYIFVNNSQFNNLKLINHFAATTKIGENQYGIDKSICDEDAIFVTNREMIEQLKRNLKCNIVSIYIKTTDKQREERLRIRGSSKEEIEEKITRNNIYQETEEKYADFIVENDELNIAVDKIEDIIENIEGKKEIIDAHSHIGIDYKYGTSKLDEYVEFCKKNGITKANVMPQPNPAYVINGKIVPCMTWQYKDGKITYETYDNTNKNPYKYINYYYYQQCKNVKEMNINFIPLIHPILDELQYVEELIKKIKKNKKRLIMIIENKLKNLLIKWMLI